MQLIELAYANAYHATVPPTLLAKISWFVLPDPLRVRVRSYYKRSNPTYLSACPPVRCLFNQSVSPTLCLLFDDDSENFDTGSKSAATAASYLTCVARARIVRIWVRVKTSLGRFVVLR